MIGISKKKDTLLILILGSLAAVGPFSIDLYLPGFKGIAHDFNTPIATVGYSLTSYFLGICFGQLIYGPLTDKYGRKKPIVIGLLFYIVASLGCALSNGIYSLVLLRGLQALGGCVGMVASRAIVRDNYPPEQTAKKFASLVLILGVAPLIAPTIGGIVAELFGWRYLFFILTGIVVLILLAVIFLLDESKTPDPSISMRPKNIIKQYISLLKNRDFFIYSLASGALSAGLFAYISGSAFLYVDMFHMSERQYGWMYSINAMGLIAGSQMNHILLKKRSSKSISITFATVQFLMGAMLIIMALYLPQGKLLFFAFIILFLLTHGVLNPNTTALAINPVGYAAGTASSLIGFIQMLSGSIASGLVSYFYNQTVYPMVVIMTIAAFSGLSLLLISKKTELPETFRLQFGFISTLKDKWRSNIKL